MDDLHGQRDDGHSAQGGSSKNGDILFAGTGVSMLAATAAKRIYSPRAVIFFETGGIDPSLDEIPMAVSDPRVMSGTCAQFGPYRSLFHRGPQETPHHRLSGRRPDRQVRKPELRRASAIITGPPPGFPGSGGACDVASFASGVITFMQHETQEVRR